MGEWYYIENNVVGNCVLWWAKNDRGYTTEIEKAELYTKEEAEKRCRHGEKMWPENMVLASIVKHVRLDHLRQLAQTKDPQ